MTTTPEYDRELIARMLDVCGHPKFTLDAYREQARLLRAADNASASAETVSRKPDARGVVDDYKQAWQAGFESGLTQQPAAARGDVRGLMAKWQKELSGLEFLPARVSWYDRGVIEGRKIAAAELEAALAAEGVQAGEVDGCHCATCTCQPGMTPAVRFDTTPADKEGAVRDHLIALGWTPPGVQQPAAVDSEPDCPHSALDGCDCYAALGQENDDA